MRELAPRREVWEVKITQEHQQKSNYETPRSFTYDKEVSHNYSCYCLRKFDSNDQILQC